MISSGEKHSSQMESGRFPQRRPHSRQASSKRSVTGKGDGTGGVRSSSSDMMAPGAKKVRMRVLQRGDLSRAGFGPTKNPPPKLLGGLSNSFAFENSTSSLAVFYVEQVALNRHVAKTTLPHKNKTQRSGCQ